LQHQRFVIDNEDGLAFFGFHWLSHTGIPKTTMSPMKVQVPHLCSIGQPIVLAWELERRFWWCFLLLRQRDFLL
jgi:hypothetical protein